MKKLKLSELNLGGAEVLTREELKKVLGGIGSGGGSGSSGCNMCCWDNYPNDCSSCFEGTKCVSGSHLSSCAAGMCD